MSRIAGLLLLVLVLLGACASSVNAQVGGVRIYTVPAGVGFYVDEQFYSGEVNFLWPAGSKHFIRADTIQCAITPNTCYTAGSSAPTPGSSGGTLYSAKSNLGQVDTWPITADPGLTYIELDFTTYYALTVSYSPCPTSGPLDCTVGAFAPPQANLCASNNINSSCWPPSAGEVAVNNSTVFWANGIMYLAAGSNVTVEAHPAEGCAGANLNCTGGWIFTGWGLMPGVPPSNTFAWTFPLNQPQTLHPLFQQAQPIQINVTTIPAGLTVLIDRTPVNGPTAYYWGWGTDHQVGAVQFQRDTKGIMQIFGSWSDGGALNHTYHVTGGAAQVLNLTATFQSGADTTFLTQPSGLQLSVDGRTNWPAYDFIWPQGSTHTVSAPLTQTDSLGHTYQFVSWSNGAPASQQYTVANLNDTRITAVYAPVAQVTLTSVPTGVSMQVDGAACTTPCTFQRSVGVQVNIATPSMIPSGDGARLVFQGWPDSSNVTRTLITTLNNISLNATYQLQYQLNTGSDPATGVVWSVYPQSGDGFYNSQSVVSVSAAPNPGYRFLNWSGDAGGANQPLALTMSTPKTIMAVLDPVPYVGANGIHNAAGDAPEQIVAPGSVIAIEGINIASDMMQGPQAPLKQTIAGITASSSGLLLPLFFVSPTQVNAQLPYEMQPGQQTLKLSVANKPDVNVPFTVSRNAPGLFTIPSAGVNYVMAAHADGTPVTSDSPAQQGETLTLFGTGFGPYTGNPPDGFALSAADGWTLVDPIDILVGNDDIQPATAGAADQKVGVNAITFVVPSDLPTATNVQIQVKINGHLSNTAVLPLQ